MTTSCCCIHIDDPADLIHTTTPIARKEHRCCECRETIGVGEKHERADVLYDGCWASYRTCTVCATIRDDLFSCGFYYGQMREAIIDCLGFDYLSDPSDWDRDEDDAEDDESHVDRSPGVLMGGAE